MTISSLSTPNGAVAIVGIGCRFPGGVVDARGFWRLLTEGRDAIGEIPASRIDVERYFDPHPATQGRMMGRRGGFLDGIEDFDPAFFGISPREAERIDPQQRLLLETAWEAIEDAGIDANRLVGSRTGVYVGQWAADFEGRLFANLDQLDIEATSGSGRYAASGRMSYVLGLRGPSLTIDSACSSSLAAVHLAVRAIRHGECPLALAGGVNLILQPHISIAYSQSRMMAPDGRCKFADASGDGYVRSEGVALVLLKPLAQALDDGDRIYAVVRGSAVNNDGRSSGVMGRPSRTGHEEMLRSAYEDAGIAPERVGYVEAHGTGTRAGDPVEIAALGAVIGAGRTAESPCLIGSVKTNFGHTESAAGIAGLIKAALTLHYGGIPASLHFVNPNPSVQWAELPFRVPTVLTEWPACKSLRVAGVNSFGISGSNAHVVLEEAPARPTAMSTSMSRRPHLLVLSAGSDAALRGLAERHAQLLEEADAPNLGDLCWQAATRRTPLEHRAAFVAADAAEMAASLHCFATGETAAAEGVVDPGVPPKIVFVLPGQGAQWTGMARELMVREPVFDEAIRECDSAARPFLDVSIREQLLAEPSSPVWQLDRIDVIQPVLVTLAIAYSRLWRELGIHPDAVVGHSMGEVAAAHIAEVLDINQAMRIICRRSALMRRASGRGAMALVELSMDEARERISGREGQLAVAVSNSPRSSVISGDPLAVAQVMAELEREQIFCRLVKVDVASHSPQMEPLAAELAAELVDLIPHDTTRTIYSTVLARSAQSHEFGAEYWARNLRQPVRFAETVTQLVGEAANIFIELGPHPVLLPSVKQTAQVSGKTVTTVACGERETSEPQRFVTAVGALWAAGVAFDWQRVMPVGQTWVTLPNYPWQRERHWSEWAELTKDAHSAHARHQRPDAESLGWLHILQWHAMPLPATTVSQWQALVVADDHAQAVLMAQALVAAGLQARAVALHELEQAVRLAVNTAVPLRLVALISDAPRAVRWPLDVLQGVVGLTSSIRPRIWFVTQGAQPVPPHTSPRVAINAAAAWGTVRVIGEEHPDLWGGLVDIDPAQALAESAVSLANHLLATDGEDQVALRGSERLVLRLAVKPRASHSPVTWRPDATYLISGGLGGVGLHVARAMVAAGARRLVLLGRTTLPPRTEWASIDVDSVSGRRITAVRELEAVGAAIHLAAVDVADAAQLRSFLQSWSDEAWPVIRGVVHAAGSMSNQLCARMDAATFDGVVEAKLRGAQLLDQMLPGLDLFVVFSSTGAFLTQAGQANYAAANAGLDALAYDRRARGLPANSIAWGVWRDTGLVQSTDGERNVAEMARQGLGSFAPERGAALFGWLCGGESAHTVVLPIDWSVFGQTRAGRNMPIYRELVRTATPAAVGTALAGTLALASTADRRKLIEVVVRECVGLVLKVAPARLDGRKTFGSMGLSSLMAMELRNRLEAALARSLSATLAWNFPTVDDLVRHLAGDNALAVAVPKAKPATAELATSLSNVIAMSDEDAALALRGHAAPSGR